MVRLADQANGVPTRSATGLPMKEGLEQVEVQVQVQAAVEEAAVEGRVWSADPALQRAQGMMHWHHDCWPHPRRAGLAQQLDPDPGWIGQP